MQLKYHIVTIEDLVPENHFLRKLEAVLDLTFVYEETAQLYSRKYGRPPIDPVVIVKYLLVGFLYGIPSERQIEERCADSNAFRWYLGIDFDERMLDHSTVSQLRRRKPAFRKVFRRLFEKVVGQCIEKGLVSRRLAVTDSTHVKANASRASEKQVEMPESPGTYWGRLDSYEEEGLETLKTRTGRRRKRRTRQIKKDTRRTKKWVSRTDPEARHMKWPEKPRGQYYLSHQTLDSGHGIIIGLTMTPGMSMTRYPYLEQVESVHQRVIPLRAAVADSAYDFPLAHRELESWGSISLSGLSRATTEPRWSSNGMRSHMMQRKMITSVRTGMFCVRKACTAAAAVCSGNTERAERTWCNGTFANRPRYEHKYFGFKPILCHPHRGQTAGKVSGQCSLCGIISW